MLEVARIHITEQEIIEYREAGPPLRIPRDEVFGIESRRGSDSAHPIIQSLFGIPLIVVGVLAMGRVAIWLFGGGGITQHEALLTCIAPLGAYLVFDALWPKQLLVVRTQRGVHKLALNQSLSAAQISELLIAVKSQYGYPVTLTG